MSDILHLVNISVLCSCYIKSDQADIVHWNNGKHIEHEKGLFMVLVMAYGSFTVYKHSCFVS
jgi:hypothetical protein